MCSSPPDPENSAPTGRLHTVGEGYRDFPPNRHVSRQPQHITSHSGRSSTNTSASYTASVTCEMLSASSGVYDKTHGDKLYTGTTLHILGSLVRLDKDTVACRLESLPMSPASP